MSDLLHLAPQGAPTLPASEPLLAQEPTVQLLGAEDYTSLLPFDELLAQVLPELEPGTESPEEKVLPEGLEPTLPELSAEDQALIAQQFMASLLVNPLVESAPAEPFTMVMPEQNNALTAQVAPTGSEASAAVTTRKQPVATSDSDTNSTQTPMDKLLPKVMMHKQAWQPVSHPVAHLPVVSMGQSQTQVNAPLRLDNTPQEMTQQLHHALGERLNLQVNNQIQHATIRLDPPEMGKIEIVLHFEAGKLQVQINAGQTDVYRALQQVSSDLRQALTEQHFIDVDVQVSSQHPQQQPGRQPQQQHGTTTPVLANNASDTHATGPREDTSILMTI